MYCFIVVVVSSSTYSSTCDIRIVTDATHGLAPVQKRSKTGPVRLWNGPVQNQDLDRFEL